MRYRDCGLQIVIACAWSLTNSFAVAQQFTFDDIKYWVGTGANSAALVIDWAEGSPSPPALAWGYHWDGDATGRDMLLAILAADAQLHAKLGNTAANPVAVYGLGYETSGFGGFALDDGTEFDQIGVAITGPADGASAVNSADLYAEGWFIGFWHYGQASTNPYDDGQWEDVAVGMAGRTLADGFWDSWTFSPTFDFSAFAENPLPAMPPDIGPPLGLPGDYDGDNRVTSIDYWVWKNSFGSQSDLEADGNGNGIVDAADYTVWRDHFGAGIRGLGASRIGVPEPSIGSLMLYVLSVLMFSGKRKERVS